MKTYRAVVDNHDYWIAASDLKEAISIFGDWHDEPDNLNIYEINADEASTTYVNYGGKNENIFDISGRDGPCIIEA